MFMSRPPACVRCGKVAQCRGDLHLLPYMEFAAEVHPCTSCGRDNCDAVVLQFCDVPDPAWEQHFMEPVPPDGTTLRAYIGALCPPCWRELGSAEERLPFHEKVVAAWHTGDRAGAGDLVRRGERAEAVRAAVYCASGQRLAGG